MGAMSPSQPRQAVACASCAMNVLCDPRIGAGSPVECRRRVARGETLHRAGSPRVALYAVRAGFLKASAPGGAAGPHIVRFLLPGDVSGLDAFGSGVHQTTVESIADAEVCVLPEAHVEGLADVRPRIAAHLRGLVGLELASAQVHATGIARLTAAQRVAAFLVALAGRWSRRGFAANAFTLPMSRRDLGEHLGLAMETVSRILGDFQERGWIALERRKVQLLRPESLEALVPDR